MKPPPFAYADPGAVPEALALLTRYGEDGKILAGGQSLVPLLNLRLAQPQVLIDLNRISQLGFIRAESRDGRPGVCIGAMTRHRQVERGGELINSLSLLREAIGLVGHPQIRNRGTIGGSIAHADPAAELPLVFRALDGVATVQSERGTRSISASDFFLYTFTPAIEPDELLADVWLPLASPCTGQAFVEVARRHGDFALVAAAVSITLKADGMIGSASIAIGGASPVPLRAVAAEESLLGQLPGRELFHRAGAIAANETEPSGDVHADAEYRREVAGTLTFRALQTAWERIPKGDA